MLFYYNTHVSTLVVLHTEYFTAQLLNSFVLLMRVYSLWMQRLKLFNRGRGRGAEVTRRDDV